jgi:hypothetical protein
MLNVASNLFTLSVIMLSVVMLSGGMLNVIMQNAVLPFKTYVQQMSKSHSISTVWKFTVRHSLKTDRSFSIFGLDHEN